jgi:hypothetical protein
MIIIGILGALFISYLDKDSNELNSNNILPVAK